MPIRPSSLPSDRMDTWSVALRSSKERLDHPSAGLSSLEDCDMSGPFPGSRPTQSSATRLVSHVWRLATWRGSPADLVISNRSLRALIVLNVIFGILVRLGLPDVALMRITAHVIGEVIIGYLIVAGVLYLARLGDRLNQTLGSWLLVNLFCDLTFFLPPTHHPSCHWFDSHHLASSLRNYQRSCRSCA